MLFAIQPSVDRSVDPLRKIPSHTFELAHVLNHHLSALASNQSCTVRRYAPSAGIDFLCEGFHDAKLASLIASVTAGNELGRAFIGDLQARIKRHQ